MKNAYWLMVTIIFLVQAMGSFSQSGCCINPNADIQAICNNVPIALCCPQPIATYPNYYSGATGFGPSDYDECSSSYFEDNTACDSGSFSSLCTTQGCCCSGASGSIVLEARCTPGNIFDEAIANEQECGTFCATAICIEDGVCDTARGENLVNCPGDCPLTSPADCNSADYKPEITLQLNHVKGEKYVALSWDEPCTADYYDILRCKGSCNPEEKDWIGQSLATSFIDTDPALLWENQYTYAVKAHYKIRTSTPTSTASITLGDIECWNQKTEDYFCIQPPYYLAYTEYLVKYLNAKGKIEDWIQQYYGNTLHMFNKAYKCDNANSLMPEGTDCGDGLTLSCVVSGNEPSCFPKEGCKNSASNPFLLFSDISSCEENNYCFYDRSYGTVDSCYSCMEGMNCYDYKTTESCQRDNCGIGSCIWKETSPMAGVCVNPDGDNCYWCDKKGSRGMENLESFNDILDQCTLEKSNQLETKNNCFYKKGRAFSCNEVDCTDYSINECSQGIVGHNEYNDITISPSNDPCSLKICQWYIGFGPAGGEGGMCFKNADANPLDPGLFLLNARDCEFGSDKEKEACEADTIAPNTTIIPVIESGVYRQLLIQIEDKLTKLSSPIKGNAAYKTYLCSYNQTENNQGRYCNRAGHPYAIFVNSSVLTVSNIKLFEGTRELMQLSEGINYIRYYSQDPAKNIGHVKNITIEAHRDTTPPIASINVTKARIDNENVYYTKEHKPNITVSFLEPAKISFAAIIDEQSRLIALSYDASGFTKKVVVMPQTELSGQYIFKFNAKGENGVLMPNDFSARIIVDDTQPLISIIPANNAIVNKSLVPVRIRANKAVKLNEVTLNGDNIMQKFGTGYSIMFNSSIIMSDGAKIVTVIAEDHAGNLGHASSIFAVNALPTNITIQYPPYGISPAYVFDINITTENNNLCRYFFSLTQPALPLPEGFNDYSSFDENKGTLHRIVDFHRIPAGNFKIYPLTVACKDGQWGISSSQFNISIDPFRPNIIVYEAADAVQLPLNTTLVVQTDKETICRYDNDEPFYEDMDYYFPYPDSYRNVHLKGITVPSEGRFLYYVACKAKNQLLSPVKIITFAANLSVNLKIIDHTAHFVNDTTAALSIETNKDAYCSWGYSSKAVNQWLGTSSKTKAHAQQIANLAIGPNTFYVQCTTGSEGETSTAAITITVDKTAPRMVYVNDSSSLAEAPEATPRTDRLRAKWLGIDDESGIGLYYYLIEEHYAPYKLMLNWSESNAQEDWVIVQGLNLSDGKTYHFKVKARNIVGLVSEEMKSDGITVDVSVSTNCSNALKDNDETDIDCGGSCNLCSLNKTCIGNADCITSYCSGGFCSQGSCNDSIKNQDETDVDCGGSCKKCEDGDKCKAAKDCESDSCRNGICRKKDSCNDNKLSSGETDVDCGGICPQKCGPNQQCEIDDDCDNINNNIKCVSGSCKACKEGDPACDAVSEIVDSDNDGIPDDCEIANELDKNNPDEDGDETADGSNDLDDDGLLNKEECGYGTLLRKKDSDDDGYDDKVEIDKGFDPRDPDSHPGSKFLLITFLIIGILVIGSALVYLSSYLYQKNQKKREMPKKAMPKPFKPAVRQPAVRRELRMPERIVERPVKREEPKKVETGKVFAPFAERIEEKREEKIEAEPKKEELPSKLKSIAPSEDIFKKLSALAKKPKGKKPKRKNKEVFEKLKKIIKEENAKKKKRGKGKKAQIMGEVFIYIFAIVLISLILIYGYNAVSDFQSRAEEVSYLKFRTDLAAAVKSISSDYKSVKRLDFVVPSGYKSVCFIRSYPSFPVLKGAVIKDPIIMDSVNDKIEKNVFLVKEVAEESFYIGSITMDASNEEGICIPVEKGKLKLELEGRGDHAIINAIIAQG